MRRESNVRNYRRAMYISILKIIIGIFALVAIAWGFYAEHKRMESDRIRWDEELKQIQEMHQTMDEIKEMIPKVQDHINESVKPVSRGVDMRRLRIDEIQELAGVVHAEAKGESDLGKMLVASVALNRHRWNKGMSMHEVLTNPNQFAPWEQYNEQDLRAVHKAMSTTEYDDLSGFHNPKTATNPEANKHEILLKVGNHVFW